MSKKLPVILNREEREALLAVGNPRYISGNRNKLLIQIMTNLGLRLAEVIALKWKDIDFTEGTLYVRQGKGAKDRLLFIAEKNWRNENDVQALLDWKARVEREFGFLPDRVFCATKKGAAGKALGPRQIRRMVERYAARAGIDKQVGPHTLRHTFATDLYRVTKNIVAVKNALGHSRLDTTMVYVTLCGDDLRQALTAGSI